MDVMSASTWAEFHRRRRAFVLSVLVLPGAVLAGAMFERVGLGFAAFLVVGALGLALYYRNGTRLALWPCPRCVQPFSVPTSLGRHWPLVDTCRHCGLARDAPVDIVAPAT